MNARAIKKKLMRNRINSLFGRRAYFTLSFPLDFFGQPVFLPAEWGVCGGMEGYFVNGTIIHCFSEVYSSLQNIKNDKPKKGTIHFVKREPYSKDVISYWEGTRYDETDAKGERTFLSKNEVQIYRDYDTWMRAAKQDKRIWEIDDWCRSSSLEIRENRVLITFGVKWFYTNYKFGFCSAVSRFLKKYPEVKIW